MTPKVLVFDFDGTLAQTMDVMVEIVNSLADELHYKKITTKQALQYKQKGAKELLKIFHIPFYKLPFLVKRGREELGLRIAQIKAVPGIKSTLNKLEKKGFKLGIITSNSVANVATFIQNNKLGDFDFIYSEDSVFGKGKVINHMLKEKELKKEEILYVGDEVRDIEACQKIGVKVVAVSWGFNTKQALKKLKPDFIIDSPEELIKIVA